MYFFRKWRASFLYGRAVMRFYQKRYEDTSRLMEKVCELDPNMERKEYCYSYLGRSYSALGQYDNALKLMLQAYELFKNQIIEDDYKQREFVDFMEAFSDTLHKSGQIDRAQEIKCELKEHTMSIKKQIKGG